MSALSASSAPLGLNRAVSATTPLQPAGNLCKIRQTKKKGLGLYAKVDIAEGTLISEEKIMKFELGEYKYSSATWENPEFWEAIRSNKVRPIEHRVSDLIASYEDDIFVQNVVSQMSRSLSIPGLSDHENLVFTNCHPHKVKIPPFSGLFGPVTCSFNHSCIANATFSVRSTEDDFHLVASVVALKAIKAGTEITISYATLPFPTAERRLKLREVYGFECVCEICMDVTHKTMESFAKMTALSKEVGAPLEHDECKQKTPWLFFKSATELDVEYMKLEIKDIRCAFLWEHCAAVAAYHSDALRTHHCLSQAVSYWKTIGPGMLVYLRPIINRPELHPRWGNTALGLSSMADNELFLSRTKKEALLARVLMIGHDHKSYDRIKPEEEDLAEKEKLAEQKRRELLADLEKEEGKKKKGSAAVPTKKAKKKGPKKQKGKRGSAGGAEEGSEETVVPALSLQVEQLNVVEEEEDEDGAGGAGWEEAGPKKRRH